MSSLFTAGTRSVAEDSAERLNTFLGDPTATLLVPALTLFKLAHCFLFIALLLLLVSTSARAQSSAADEADGTAPAYGSITGRVVGDDGRPLAGVVVFINMAYANATPRGTTTDSAGRFQFKELGPGLYLLRVNAPSYVEQQDENKSPWEPRFVRPGESVQLTVIKGGVITGTVLTPQGEPLVSVNVRAVRVRDAQGRRVPLEAGYGGQVRFTDDRGIYRIYGLQPGSYILVAGGNSPYVGMFNPFEADAPTYYPSSTRDTAVEVTVRAGEEATGTDIRYRNERGHTISGTLSGMPSNTNRYSINMMLMRASTGVLEFQSFVYDTGSGQRVFSLTGVPDGDFELVAQGFLEKGESIASMSRKVTVRGSDITGLRLELLPLSSVSGRVTLEPAKDEACRRIAASTALQQTLVTTRRDDWDKERQQPPAFSSASSIPNEQGEFTTRNLDGGTFRLSVRPPGDDWYVRAATAPIVPGAVNATAKQSGPQVVSPTTAPGAFVIKRGERLSGATINLVQGAASIAGRVTPPSKGAALPASLRAFLVPVETERADDILRYAETNVASNGTFTFSSLAPGRYKIVLRTVPQTESTRAPRLLAWDEEPRKALRREAETIKDSLELKPCQRLTDYALSYAVK
jgi:hypothetical protein